MLSFPLTSVRAVIARGRTDAEANGGFRDPYYGLRLARTKSRAFGSSAITAFI